MRRLLSNLASKLLTGKSLETYATERLTDFYEKNQIFGAELTCYRSDNSPTHPNLMIRTYIGTGRKNSATIGLLISYDEGCGYTYGYSVASEKVEESRLRFYDYKINPMGHDEFISYFRLEVCDGDAVGLIDTVGNDFSENDVYVASESEPVLDAGSSITSIHDDDSLVDSKNHENLATTTIKINENNSRHQKDELNNLKHFRIIGLGMSGVSFAEYCVSNNVPTENCLIIIDENGDQKNQSNIRRCMVTDPSFLDQPDIIDFFVETNLKRAPVVLVWDASIEFSIDCALSFHSYLFGDSSNFPALSIAIKPFQFEGHRKIRLAEKVTGSLKTSNINFQVFSCQDLLSQASDKDTFVDAFNKLNSRILKAAEEFFSEENNQDLDTSLKSQPKKYTNKKVNFEAYTFNFDAENKSTKVELHCANCNSYSEHIINIRMKEKICRTCRHTSEP